MTENPIAEAVDHHSGQEAVNQYVAVDISPIGMYGKINMLAPHLVIGCNKQQQYQPVTDNTQ